ncbi:MAG: Hsp20/alpha crystallin family protein, partial [bacterium]
NTHPRVNILNEPEHVSIEIAAPGMKKDDFNLELNNHVLFISSKEDRPSNGNFLRQEFDYKNFERRIELPGNLLEEDKIEARYDAGILYVTIPKKEEAKTKPPKQIEIA